MKIGVALIVVLLASGCASSARNSPEAAWRRAQCEQNNDQKMREKCVEQVEREFGR